VPTSEHHPLIVDPDEHAFIIKTQKKIVIFVSKSHFLELFWNLFFMLFFNWIGAVLFAVDRVLEKRGVISA